MCKLCRSVQPNTSQHAYGFLNSTNGYEEKISQLDPLFSTIIQGYSHKEQFSKLGQLARALLPVVRLV